MTKICKQCSSSFDLSEAEKALLGKMRFVYGERVFHPPEPVFCPACRLRIRSCHRNERFLYRVPSAASGKDTVSIFHAEPVWGEPYKIYSETEWKSDALDPLRYGITPDPSVPFFDQWKILHKSVPRLGVINLSNANSEYVTGTAFSKNCYLTNSTENTEDGYYGKLLQRCRNVVDCAYLYDSELCYECFSCSKCYDCAYVSYSQNCQDCLFSSNLSGCDHCCLCVNLNHKSYHVLNEPVSREEYEKHAAALRSHGMTEDYKKRLADLRRSSVQRYAQIVNSENCTGDCIENSQNCVECYDMTDSQDCHHVHVGVQVKDVIDCGNMYIKSELCYEIMGTIETYNSAYCLFIFNGQNMLYSEYCYFCNDCFGCSGLTRMQYCVFNKQYTKEEYEVIVPRIIDAMIERGEWGRFFPPGISPFGYNESLAQEYLPLSKEEAKKRGFHWYEAADAPPQVKKIIPAARLPDTIADVPDDVLQWAIQSERSGRAFRIVKPELDFYRQMGLPLPHLHPDERYDDRAALRNPRHLWDRACAKCQKTVQSTFAPSRPETVYCDECYRAAIY